MGSACSTRETQSDPFSVEKTNRRVLLRDCSLRQPLGRFRYRKPFELQWMDGPGNDEMYDELKMSHQMEKREPTW